MHLLEYEYGFSADKIFVTWECEWTVQRKNPEIAKYLQEHPPRPLTRLFPQQAVKTALNESYVLHFNSCNQEKNTDKKSKLYAADMSSLFPYCALNLQVPLGQYSTVVGEEINFSKLLFTEENFIYDGNAYQGLLQARVLPPQNLLHPFLLTKVKSQSLAVLCRTCAVTLRQKQCNHNEEQRSLTDVWTTVELCFAVSKLNYKVLDVYEMMLYTEKGPILEKFVCLLGWHKIRFAPLPVGLDVRKNHEMQAYCDLLNEQMKFKDRIGKTLQIADLQPSKLFRAFFKNALNKWLGHFSTNLEKRTVTKIIDSRDDLEYYAARGEVDSITLVNSRYLQLTLNSKTLCKNRQVSRKSCATIGAFVTSMARIVIFKEVMALLEKQAQILKISCDAVFFSLPFDCPNFLNYSEAFGFWKPIYPNQLSALSQMGIYNYSVLYEGDNNEMVSEAKCSGLTMTHLVTTELTYSVYSDAVHTLIKNKLFDFRQIKYAQIRKKTDLKNVTTGYVRKERSIFSRNVLSRRKLVKDSFETIPYGWKC